MNPAPLSKRARALLAFLRENDVRTATNAQIAARMGVSKSTVSGALAELTGADMVVIHRTDPHPVDNPSGREVHARARLVDLEFQRTNGRVSWGATVCHAAHRARNWFGCTEGTCQSGAYGEPEFAAVAWNLLHDGDLDISAVNPFITLAPEWTGSLGQLVASVNTAVSDCAA